MLKIPLHALIVMVGPSGAGKSTFVDGHFKSHEVVSMDKIREELTGDFRNQHVNDIVFEEFNRRVEIKLRLGERVVADATHIRKKDRVRTAIIGAELHVPVVYIVINRPLEDKLATAGWRADVPDLIERQDRTFVAQEKDILKGDGMATVIDTRLDQIEVTENVEVVEKMNFDNLTADLKERGYKGVAIIGDVHGMSHDFEEKIGKAKAGGYFIIQLGDIVDYGPDAVRCVDLMYKLVMNGEGAFIIGNHERKFEKYLKQKAEGHVRIEIKGGIVQTIEQLNRLGDAKLAAFEDKFHALMSHARHHIVFEAGGQQILTVHASGTRKMWKNKVNRLVGFDENRAVFGEIDQAKPKLADGYPNRQYNWVDEIPAKHKIYVGHAVLSVDAVLIKKGKLGGKAIFVDTGSAKEILGKEGFLSMVMEDFE